MSAFTQSCTNKIAGEMDRDCHLDIDGFVNNEAHTQRTKPLLTGISLDVCLQCTRHVISLELHHDAYKQYSSSTLVSYLC